MPNRHKVQRTCSIACGRIGNPAERFWAKVDRSGGPEACWPWTGALNPDGYGNVGSVSRYWKAHRRAWTLANGPIPAGKHVLHSCDNPPCCNPDHLWLGTHADNMADMVAKGRDGRRRLTEAAVLEGRALRLAGWTFQQIADRYGVSRSGAFYAVTGKTWRHELNLDWRAS